MESIAINDKKEELNPIDMCQVSIKEECDFANTSNDKCPPDGEKSLTPLKSLQEDFDYLKESNKNEYPDVHDTYKHFASKESLFIPLKKEEKFIHNGFDSPAHFIKTELNDSSHSDGFSPTVYFDQLLNRNIAKSEDEKSSSFGDNYNLHWNTSLPPELKNEKFVDSTTLYNSHISSGQDLNLERVEENIFKSEESNSFQCNLCKMTFSRKTTWKKHQSSHIREKNLLCTYCNAKFDDRALYESHLVVHTGIVKPFECYFCKKRFTRKNHLTRHIFTHTGERPFACTDCSEKFTRREHLERHRLLHTGELPFKCPLCNMKFRRKSYLKTHQCVVTTQNQLSPEAYL